MNAPTIEKVAPSRIPEVSAVMKTAKALDDWKERHPEAWAELAQIADVWNPAIKAGEKAVRERHVASGPYDLYQYMRRDNGAALLKAVGRQKFASVGGVITPSESFTVDRERFDLAIAQEKVDAETVARVVAFSPCFHLPEPIVIPGRAG
jgi:hypothetical protein